MQPPGRKSLVFLSLLIFFFLANAIRPQQNHLKFDVDFARFRTTSDFVFVEIYYSLFRQQLQFVATENGYRADFRIETRILMQDSVVVQDVLNNVTYADSLTQVTPSQTLTNLSRIVIRTGSYRLNVRITDLHSKKFGEMETDLNILPFAREHLAISDIELASRIQAKDRGGKFYKNKYQVIPNPAGLYGTGAPILYFYAEIYNLTPKGDIRQYQSKYTLLDGNGNEIRVFQDRAKNKPGSSCVEVSGFNIISLHSGTYFLRLEIEDLDSREKVSALKRFYVYRPADFQSQPPANRVAKYNINDYLNSSQYQYYDTLDEKSLIAEFEGAGYIASREEKRVFADLDLAGKRNFMKRFWLKRDTEPATIRNEYRDEYLKRLRYANENFAVGKPGWKADRGRVLLFYGMPDEIERFPSSSDNRAYEIWNYYKIQGGVIFVFVDIRGFGDYVLVHSTARDELQDYDWQRWLSPQ